MPPLVSIVIPAYNAGKTLPRAIDSVLNQTYEAVELIVVNDGSTDDTAEVCVAYGGRIRVLYQKNEGVSAARNAGIQIALGRYIGFLDADDWYLPEKLSNMVPLFSQHPDIKFVTCAGYYQREHARERHPRKNAVCIAGESCKASYFKEKSEGNTIINTDSILVDRDVFSQIGMFDISLHYGEDLDLWTKISGKYSGVYLNRVLYVRDLTATNRATDSVSGDCHPTRFLLYDAEIPDVIRNECVADYKRFRQKQYLDRLFIGLCNRNDPFVRKCVHALKDEPWRLEMSFVRVCYLPRVLWPIGAKGMGKVLGLMRKIARMRELFR